MPSYEITAPSSVPSRSRPLFTPPMAALTTLHHAAPLITSPIAPRGTRRRRSGPPSLAPLCLDRGPGGAVGAVAPGPPVGNRCLFSLLVSPTPDCWPKSLRPGRERSPHLRGMKGWGVVSGEWGVVSTPRVSEYGARVGGVAFLVVRAAVQL